MLWDPEKEHSHCTEESNATVSHFAAGMMSFDQRMMRRFGDLEAVEDFIAVGRDVNQAS